MYKFIVVCVSMALLLTGCGHARTQATSVSNVSNQPDPPIVLSKVRDVKVQTFFVDHPKTPIASKVISSGSVEQTILREINSSKIIVYTQSNWKVVAPILEPKSKSYKVTVALKDGAQRVFHIGSWGPTHDSVYRQDITPGISRKVLQKVLEQTSK